MSTPFCVSPPNLAHRTKKHRKTCSKHRSPPLTSLSAVTPPHLMYSSVGPDDSVRPNTRLPHPHFVLILSFRASAHTGVGIRIPRPLPLPLGEVAERSEDGEGKQRRAASRRPFFQLVDKPILSFRGAPQGYLLRGAKRRGNPQSFSCKFAEKRKNCAIRGQIATPVCGLARNDGLFRQPVSTRSVDGGIVTSGRGRAPPLHTPTDSLCAIRAGGCGHPPLRNHRRRMRHTHGRTESSAPIHGFPAAKYFQPAAKGRHLPLPLRGKGAI